MWYKTNFTEHANRHSRGHDCKHCHTPHLTSEELHSHTLRLHTTQTSGQGIQDDFVPAWRVNNVSQHHSTKFKKTLNSYQAKLENSEKINPTYQNFDILFKSLIDNVVPQSNPSDYVGVIITSDSLDFPIPISYVKVSEFNSAKIFHAIESALNSNQNFQLDSKMNIQVDHVVSPTGSGRHTVGEYKNFATAMKGKKSVIRIREDDDHLCLPSSIILAIERYKAFNTKESHCYNTLRRTYTKNVNAPCVQKLKALSIELLKRSGLTPKPCGIAEIDAIQAIIPEYRLTVYTARGGKEIIYQGPKADRNIYLILDEIENHYHVLTKLTGYYAFPQHCPDCNILYNHKYTHNCKSTCTECRRIHETEIEKRRKWCGECQRSFSSELCYKNHLEILDGETTSVCSSIRRCENCHVVCHKARHYCGRYCKKCGTQYDPAETHECYIMPKKFKALKNRKFIFYDLESMLVPLPPSSKSKLNSQHVPNLVVAWRVCAECADAEAFNGREDCNYCGAFSFKGEGCISEFIQFIFNGENKGASCFSHNGSAYDNLFIYRELQKEGKEPQIKNKGNRLLEITIKRADIRFVDSLNFLVAGLSKLPAMFDLTLLKKGFFPHRFNLPENQKYIGAYPNKAYYGMSDMRGGHSDVTGELTGQIAEFEQFYNSVKDGVFDLQKELYQYCLSDVLILKDACLKFRRDFIATTKMDPLIRHMTLSQLSMDFYRSKLMRPYSIARITENSHFEQRKQSVRAMQWLHYIEKKLGRKLIKKSSLGEKKIGPYFVDGYDEPTNTVYEFLGDYWHGNLKVYDESTKNSKLGKTMLELNTATVERLNYIHLKGYNIITIWESDFMVNEEMQKFAEDCTIPMPLAPRDALFGGRVNALKLKHEVKPGEEIFYDDYVSLYPSVLKYSRFPVGQPEIIVDNFKPLSEYFGLMKCRVLPPTDLYIPVLPQRFKNKKLVFCLCRTCAQGQQQVECHHSESERMLTGTWCTPELEEAVKQGYVIKEVFEVWHFKKSSQYSVTPKEIGLFQEYVDTFFKLKLQYSGWPPGCTEESQKDEYIDRILQSEGLKLSKADIKKNNGLRSLAKLMLNSFWGKFGQQSNMSQKKVVTSRAEMLKLINDPAIIVQNMTEINDFSLMITYKNSADFIEGGKATNVIIAAFVTCWGRLKLYSLLSKLGDQVLYFDTDSCIWLKRGDGTDYIPPRGEFLGDLKSELTPGNTIISFASSGPKSYTLTYKKPENGQLSKVVLKGISLSYGNSKLICYDTILDKIEKFVTKQDNSSTAFYETENFFYRAPDFQVYMRHLTKHFKVTYDKRLICEDFTTLPYGYRKNISRKRRCIENPNTITWKKRMLAKYNNEVK